MGTLASPTLQQLLTSVRSFLKQPNSSNSKWTDTELTEYINEGVRRYFGEVVQNSEGLFTKVIDLDITADTETVDMPSDFFEIVRLYRNKGNYYQILNYHNDTNLSYSKSGNGSSSSYIPYYYFRDQKIVLRPIPSFNQTAGLRLEYISFPSTMIDGGDSMTNNVSPIFKDLIQMYAVYKAKVSESIAGNGINTYGPAYQMLGEIYKQFQDVIRNRAHSNQYIAPFSPEDEY